MDVFHFDTGAEYRQQAEKIRTIAAQVSLLEAQLHLLEAAEHLEKLAADEGGQIGRYSAGRSHSYAPSGK